MSVNAAYIKDKGGNKKVLFLKSALLAVTTTATTLTNGTDFLDLGHLTSSGASITPATNEFKSEDGIIRASETTYSGKSVAVPMQTSKELIDFLAFTSRSNDYIEYTYLGYKNAKNQDMFAQGQVESGFNITSPGGASSMSYSFIYTPPDTAVLLTTIMIAVMRASIGLSTMPYVTEAVSLPANTEVVIKES